jgi:hypothetical protein
MDIVRYGVFAVGQIWTLCSGDGRARGFTTRSAAVSAAFATLRELMAQGLRVELLVQDETGFLHRADLASLKR